MFPNKKHSKRRPRAAAQSSPSAPRAATPAPTALPSSHRPFTPSTSLVDQELETLQDTSSFLLESLQISLDGAATPTSPNPNPRSFPYSVKQQCWDKADRLKGRDPDRWRRDAVGNIVFRKLVGCPGCLCHDYDHIVPYSKVVLWEWEGIQIELVWIHKLSAASNDALGHKYFQCLYQTFDQ
ncbi:uncharacterized protein LOC115734939 isoform X2 [Rhodamnia argentea]|uniref:Uncharacterized protein LOC115734939 isoform X2 n=1 Tax=Rhodamnia argentea TaxID=178133 RepID=A0ABM3HPL3_9MYRT|nr:uncharacterized protein LOC115734939 isoform X2 [Rhodamnia argentea]